jgi:hypothetical protein
LAAAPYCCRHFLRFRLYSGFFPCGTDPVLFTRLPCTVDRSTRHSSLMGAPTVRQPQAVSSHMHPFGGGKAVPALHILARWTALQGYRLP